MRIFIIRDWIQNSGNRIKFMDKKEFVQSIKNLLESESNLCTLTFGYMDDDKDLEVVKLDNDTIRVILGE